MSSKPYVNQREPILLPDAARRQNPPLLDTAGQTMSISLAPAGSYCSSQGGAMVMRCRKNHQGKNNVRHTCQCLFASRRRT